MQKDSISFTAPVREKKPLDPQLPLDYASLVANCGGDHQLIRDLSAVFEMQANLDISRIERAIADANPGDLRQAAHSLKGSAGFVAAEHLRTVALRLENAGRSGQFEETQKLASDARKDVEVCIRFLADVAAR